MKSSPLQKRGETIRLGFDGQTAFNETTGQNYAYEECPPASPAANPQTPQVGIRIRPEFLGGEDDEDDPPCVGFSFGEVGVDVCNED